MSNVSAPTDLLVAVVALELEDEAAAAARNHQLSKAEEATLPEGVLSRVAAEMRRPGKTIQADELGANAGTYAADVFASVNQKSGPGISTGSKAEILAAHRKDADVGRRFARAYELITGRRITLGASDAPTAAPLRPGRIAQITTEARRVALSGDMMNGEIPVGPRYQTLEVLRGDPAANGRAYTVYIPLTPNTDANAIELMWLLSVDAEGIQRTATFEVPALSAAAVMSALEPSVGTNSPRVRGEIEVFNESGDNGVNTFAAAFAGALDLEDALARAQALWSSSWGFGSWGMDVQDGTAAHAIEKFVATARALYTEEGRDPAEVGAIIQAFADRVQQTFASLEDVRLVTGPTVNSERGGTYLFGKTNDGWVGLAVRQYRDR
jgi:hypothetical protein